MGKWSVITTVSFGDPRMYERNLRNEISIARASKSTIIHRTFEANSSFHVKLTHYRKSLISFFLEIFTSNNKMFISWGGLISRQ